MFETISLYPCQTIESSSHGTTVLIENLKKAIAARDLPSILQLKLQKAYWDWDDLHAIYKDLAPLIESNQDESNIFVVQTAQIIFLDQDYRDAFLDFLLQKTCSSGNLHVALGLKNLCPEWWEGLKTDELGFLMDPLLHSIPKNQNPQFIQAGKKEIYYLLTSHNNWVPDSDNLPDLFPYLLNPDKMTVEKDELNQLACAFLKVPNLEEISVGLLAEVVKTVLKRNLNGDPNDFLAVLTSLPNWNKIPPYSYAFIVECIFSELSNYDSKKIEFFLSHPSWHRIDPRVLCELANYYQESEAIIPLIAKNERWNQLSVEELMEAMNPRLHYISPEAIEVFASHPAWTQISCKDLVRLACKIIDLGDGWEFFLKVSSHPHWEELTQKDLSKIAHKIEYYGRAESLEKILEKLKEHKNWKD